MTPTEPSAQSPPSREPKAAPPDDQGATPRAEGRAGAWTEEGTSEARERRGKAPGEKRPAARGRAWRAAFFALAGFAILAGVVWALLGSRLLVVRSISVTGTHLVTRAQVLAAADVPLGTPLMRVNTAQVVQRVEAIRQVASATVTKDWPDHLAITVRERVPVVAVRVTGGGYDLLDAAGVIVRSSAARPPALPLFLTSLPGGGLRGDPALAQISAVLAQLPQWLFESVAEVTVSGPAADDEQVTLSLRDHKTVVWGGPGRPAEKARELAILLRTPAHYIDVSAPGTAVTRQ